MRFLVFFLLIFLSCSENAKNNNYDFQVNDAQVVFVVEDDLWNSTIDSLVKTTFGQKIEGLLKNEPMFFVVQTNNTDQLPSLLKSNKNVVSVIIITQDPKVLDKKNSSALNEFVTEIYWQNNSEKLVDQLLELRSQIVLNELASIKKEFAKLSQTKIETQIAANFNIDVVVPKHYQILKNEKNFFWGNYDPQDRDEIKNIFIFSFPRSSKYDQNQLLHKTDSIFAKYLVGEEEGTYAKIETEIPIYNHENLYRGVWTLEGGFMGGVFIIKVYHLKNKTVVNIGFVFAPQNSKRKYIKEFEAIL